MAIGIIGLTCPVAGIVLIRNLLIISP